MSRFPSQAKQVLTEFGDLFEPEEAQEPILSRPVRGALMEWLTEIWAEKALAELKVKPRRKALFDGPPGVGKTTLAHHLAARLGLPMLAVRPDKIIDCWVGSSGRNIGALFEAAKSPDRPIVLFIDEFDALAPKRTVVTQGADQHRNEAVNTLLQRLEQHTGFVIAATNFPERVDEAIWRRFEIQIHLTLPDQEARERILALYLDPLGLPKRALVNLAQSMGEASPALMRSFCENLKRQIVVGPQLKLPMTAEAVVERLLAACQPHPDLPKPQLWSVGAGDRSIKGMPWPLPLAADLADDDSDALSADPAGHALADVAAGKPITANPYPFGDDRRPAYDAAWQVAAGSDGMGPGGGNNVVTLGKKP